jgi:membrane dipeptidase
MNADLQVVPAPPDLIFDAHLDLSMNAVEWNRDLTRPLSAIRQREAHRTDRPDRGRGTVCLPELRRGGVRLVVATLIARIEHNAFSPVAGWASPAQAWAMTQGQRAWYRAMEEAGEMVQIRDRAGLEAHLSGLGGVAAGEGAGGPVGYVMSLEGADSILSPAHLERAWADGLRAIGPAHYGPGVYANGTDATGGFNARGRELIREMDRLGFILDATHLCDDCFWEALDLFHGPVWASHHNCRSLVPHNRQLSDEMIRALVARDAVIGAALDAWMLVPGWVRGTTTPQSSGVALRHVLDHIDHVCQVAGNARHAGIGSDLDGAFGTEQTPGDLDSIADLRRIPEGLRARGYSDSDVAGMAHGNFLRVLRRAWGRGAN